MKHSEVKLVQMVAKILYAKGELFKLHDEFLVVNLIFFSKLNAGIMIFIARDFYSGEQCSLWASCLFMISKKSNKTVLIEKLKILVINTII